MKPARHACGLAHDVGADCEQAKERLRASIDLIRIRLGADFETHGGKRVMYKGCEFGNMVRPGTMGIIESTSRREDGGETVMVKWDGTSVTGVPNPMYGHGWDELVVFEEV